MQIIGLLEIFVCRKNFPKGLNEFSLSLPYSQRNKGNYPTIDFFKNSVTKSYFDMALRMHSFSGQQNGQLGKKSYFFCSFLSCFMPF